MSRDLAESRIVYVLRDKEGRALYVGLTNNVERRVSQHKSKRWGWQIESAESETLSTRAEAVAREAARIAELHPPHNVQHLARDRANAVIDWPAVARRYDAGETYEELHLDLGVKAGTIRKHIKDLVIPRPKGGRSGVRKKPNPRAGSEGRGIAPAARIARASVARMYR